MRTRPPASVRRLLAPLFWLPLVLLFFGRLAFTNLILARGDTFLYFYPYWDYRARALLAGRLPLWNPFLFMGAPFLANSQAGVLYPLNWPLAVFAAPVAVKISILLHLTLAAAGAYVFARRALRQSAIAAALAALLFALGGYLTAQAEHINQLQALAWFPWLLLAVQSATAAAAGRSLRGWAYRLLPAAAIVALQLLAGHTQSVFISLSGAALYAMVLILTPVRAPAARRPVLLALGALALIALGGGLLAAAQVLPTLELSRESLRGGGLALREALSFSLSPRLLGRALLPGYSRGLFSEFTAYIGVIGLGLIPFGLGRAPQRLALAALAVVGLAFALGGYNPLYALLAAVPPFDLFRVPARWLFLFAFAAAMLAGCGLDALNTKPRRPYYFVFLIPLALAALTPLASGVTAPGETGALGAPQALDWLGWMLALAGLAVLAWVRLPPRARSVAVTMAAAMELFSAAQVLPVNHLTTPEAYSSVRPAMTQLLAALPDSLPPARFLSMSALRFDPGDLKELRAELEPQLPADAVYDALIATKHKEVLSPNLPLTWGIPAVDGLDGGILPLKHYAEFTKLFTGTESADGRLRENMTAPPDPRLLSLVNARYLVTDKVGDAWVDEVFYDLQFPISLAAGETYRVTYVPRFVGTGLGLVTASTTGRVQIIFTDGTSADLALGTLSRRAGSVVAPFGRPAAPVVIAFVGPLELRGASLVDERTGAFQMLALGPYRLVHSGDVKIYENPNALPRAFVAPNALVIAAPDAARAALANPGFNPAATIILAEAASPAPPASTNAPAPVPVVSATPETMRLLAQGPGYLVLTDAFYPGWAAYVDGRRTPILRADIMFRAVPLQAGLHTIEFRFEPLSVSVGLWLSSAAWLGALAAWLLRRSKKPAGLPPAAQLDT